MNYQYVMPLHWCCAFTLKTSLRHCRYVQKYRCIRLRARFNSDPWNSSKVTCNRAFIPFRPLSPDWYLVNFYLPSFMTLFCPLNTIHHFCLSSITCNIRLRAIFINTLTSSSHCTITTRSWTTTPFFPFCPNRIGRYLGLISRTTFHLEDFESNRLLDDYSKSSKRKNCLRDSIFVVTNKVFQNYSLKTFILYDPPHIWSAFPQQGILHWYWSAGTNSFSDIKADK